MNYRFSLPVLLAALFAITIANTSCKEGALINAKISPSDTALGVYSTELSCITHTYYDDTAVTGYYISGLPVYQGIGNLSDPFFGTMTGYTSFQVIPENPSIAVYENATIDSATLVLPYTGYSYGDTTDQSLTQSYQAFFLNEELSTSTLYYSYTSKSIDQAIPLSPATTVNLHKLQDSVTVNGKNYLPSLRLKLNVTALRSRLTPALTAASANPNTPNAAFLSVFKGLCVKAGNSLQTTKAYPFFRLTGSNSSAAAGIIVYYHSNGSTSDTAVQHYFFDGSSCGFFNNVTKSFSHSPVSNLLNSAQGNDSIIALQNQPGACLDVMITGIKSLPSGIINKAQLQLAMLPGYNDLPYGPVARMYPRRVSNGTYPSGSVAGAEEDVYDRYPTTSLTPFDILDGQLHTLSRNGTDVPVYTIGLPREIMHCIAAKNDTLHLRITGTQDYIGAYRAILGGGNHPNPLYKAKLFVVYSKLN